jgi:tRNA threonylcarbamoyladenosine biosynthesis protein TsaE
MHAPAPLGLPPVNVTVYELGLSVASVDDAADMVEVIHAAFGARPQLDPPSTASEETPESVAATIRRGGGVLARVDERPAGVVLIAPVAEGLATFQRVSVHPDFQRHGVASATVAAAQDYAGQLGYDHVELFARAEFAELIAFWQHRGFDVVREQPHGVILGKRLPTAVDVDSGEAMQDLGERLAGVLAAGDLVIATGDLGAGKTTLTQGIGRGLGTADPVISPTFVISRIHHTPDRAPDLVHVDAYRLSGRDEIDDLDLDASMASAVTVVEWGEGMAESLSSSRLEVDIRAVPGDGSRRTVLLRGIGDRWRDVDLARLSGDRPTAQPMRPGPNGTGRA